MKEEFVSIELAKKLKEKGFNGECAYACVKEQTINPEIIEKYGNLSDDGYYELTKDGGGELDLNEVYIYETRLALKNTIRFKNDYIEIPTLSQAMKWLREEKKIYIAVLPTPTFSTIDKVAFFYQISYNSNGLTMTSEEQTDDDGYYTSWEEAVLEGIEYVINNLL